MAASVGPTGGADGRAAKVLSAWELLVYLYLLSGLLAFLRETSVVSNTDGSRNIGTLVMTFEVTTVRPEASLPVTS
ncbi:hypothetical protein [Paracoccus mutanolyticus]|uniref:hypothetical protein n=1 Tax=Paracoccus mutanolyticus TaxID=1499308 RepID=UPI0016792BE9|nr:hypothetical protein [Paracoccus mutanolyticus]